MTELELVPINPAIQLEFPKVAARSIVNEAAKMAGAQGLSTADCIHTIGRIIDISRYPVWEEYESRR